MKKLKSHDIPILLPIAAMIVVAIAMLFSGITALSVGGAVLLGAGLSNLAIAIHIIWFS